MSIQEFAKSELERAGWFSTDGFYGGLMGQAVMKMIDDFAKEGHSGMSASIAVDIFKTLANWEPLTPLTGEDDEWDETGEGVFQNRRCSRVFKNADGQAYDINGRVFREPNGVTYTSRESRVYVTFPYTPKTEIVDVNPTEGN